MRTNSPTKTERPRRKLRGECEGFIVMAAAIAPIASSRARCESNGRLAPRARARQPPFRRHKRNSARRIDQARSASAHRGEPLSALPAYASTTRSALRGQYGNARATRASSATIGAGFALHLHPGIESGKRRTLLWRNEGSCLGTTDEEPGPGQHARRIPPTVACSHLHHRS